MDEIGFGVFLLGDVEIFLKDLHNRITTYNMNIDDYFLISNPCYSVVEQVLAHNIGERVVLLQFSD